MPKSYPLEIENWGSDDYILGSKGHHDPDEFMRAVANDGYTWPMGTPTHSYYKAVPDSSGEFNVRYFISKQGVRGAFPVTVSHEAYGEDQYKFQ